MSKNLCLSTENEMVEKVVWREMVEPQKQRRRTDGREDIDILMMIIMYPVVLKL